MPKRPDLSEEYTKHFAHPIRAWIIWFLSALFMFYKYALEVSPSVMTKTLMSTFHISGAELGNFAATYFYAYLIMQIPAGLLLDKFGPRKVTTIAIALCALGGLIFAKADTLLVAGIGRFLTGAGAAFGAVNCLKLIANWFPFKHFAFMTGLMMTVGMLGAVGGQAPLSTFIDALDWRQAMTYISMAGVILALLFALVVRDKAPDHKKSKRVAPLKMPLMDGLIRVLKSSQSWWLAAYSGFAFAPVMIFGGLWGVAFLAETYQLSQGMAAGTVSWIFIGFAFGAPIFGWFSDWVGRRNIVMFWGTFLALICISIVIYAPGTSQWMLSILLFLFGFFISSFLLCFTMIREINLVALSATAIGFMNAFDALFGAFSDPMTGKFLDLGWDGKLVDGARIFSVETYKWAFLTIPIYLVISLVMMARIKETYCKQVSPPSSLP